MSGISNPVDLQPVLTQLQQALDDLQSINTLVAEENSAIAQALNQQSTDLTALIQDETAQIDAILESLTTVNGQLDTNVTAINQNTDAAATTINGHTTTKAAEVSQAVETAKTDLQNHVTQEVGAVQIVKSIQRGAMELSSGNSGYFYLGGINLEKSTINILTGSDLLLNAELEPYQQQSRIRLQAASGSETRDYSWEVIEYA